MIRDRTRIQAYPHSPRECKQGVIGRDLYEMHLNGIESLWVFLTTAKSVPACLPNPLA